MGVFHLCGNQLLLHQYLKKVIFMTLQIIALYHCFLRWAVFEKVVNRQLMEHMDMFSLLCQSRHSFRQKKSYEIALIRLSNLLFHARSKKLFTCIITIDFSEAFNTLNLHYIIKALQACYTDDVCLNWFKSYLISRSQRTKYSETFSGALPVTTGVPQVWFQ